MAKNQLSGKIFKELFKLFDKYGNNLVLYCHSNDSNRIACNMTARNKLEARELEIMEILKNILGKNHLDKLNKLKYSYEKYKKSGLGDIKFAFMDGNKFYMSIDDIMNDKSEHPISQTFMNAILTSSGLIVKDNIVRINETDDSDDYEDSDESIDSIDSVNISETTYAIGGKKSKKAIKSKKNKKKAKKELKNSLEAMTVKADKKRAKEKKKTMKMTKEGQEAKVAKKKVKELKKSSASQQEIQEAKIASKKAKHAMKMTPEGQAAKQAYQEARKSYKKMEDTSVAKKYKNAKKLYSQARESSNAEEIPPKISLKESLVGTLKEKKQAIGESVRQHLEQSVETIGEQIIGNVSQVVHDSITDSVNGISDKIIGEPERREEIVTDKSELQNDVIQFLEKIFGQTTSQTKELTGLVETSIQNDKKIIALLEKIYNDTVQQKVSDIIDK
jgi:hypothetical protein